MDFTGCAGMAHTVDKAVLTVTAKNVFRATGMPNLNPLPHKITGFQNGQKLANSGVAGAPLLTTTATTGSPVGDYPITCALGDLTADNYSFTLIDCRNGWTYSGTARTTLVDDGNGNMMDAHVNSTLDPDNGLSNSFKMEMKDIPFRTYDVIFYMGANSAQYGDGKGAIIFNGGPERDFTIKPGPFDGTFTEMVDATTPGNYIVYKGVTGSSFTVQTYGKGPTGFNHLGPFGFQIRAGADDYSTWAANYPGANLNDPNADYDGDGVSNDDERLFGLDPTDSSSLSPISVPLQRHRRHLHRPLHRRCDRQ